MDTTVVFGRTAEALGLLDWPTMRRESDGSFVFERRNAPPYQGEHRLVLLTDPEAAAAFVHTHPVDAVVVDLREEVDTPLADSRAGRFLARVFPDGEPSGSVPRARVLGVVAAGEVGARDSFAFGAHRIGGVLVEPSLEELIGRLESLLKGAQPGRVALCIAGGGIEGLLYEVGVLRALETFLADRSIVDVDFFCGISSGAVIGSFLANGIGPDEIARGLAGGSARIDPMRRSDLFDPNFRELGERALRLAGDLIRGGRGPRGAVSSVARAVPSAMFAGDGLRAWLERQLTKPGMQNQFKDLRRPLLIGATDQDTSEAVVFGEPGFDHVPIHRAVRASAALSPFYRAENIDGRYYIDGAFSRTTNMRLAVEHGATLVILIDPLVPIASALPGYVQERGAIYSTMQGLKALINGRFDKAVRAIREMFPDVAFYLFRPEEDERRILSGSPMKYFYRREIEDVAYEATLRKMRHWLPEMTRDFARHGITFRDPEVERHGTSRSARPLEPGALGVGV
ncbi:MAG: patatin-like phospholipase family protein [Polyangiales bacterium]|nr:patatin-like phospholipase family protein [Myxococcales bacterium]